MKERTETCWEFLGCPVVKTSPSYTGGVGLIPGQAAMIPHASWPKNQNIKQKQYCNKFNKENKNGPHQKNILKKKRIEACVRKGNIFTYSDVFWRDFRTWDTAKIC